MARRNVGQWAIEQSVSVRGVKGTWTIDAFPSRRTARVVRPIQREGVETREVLTVSLRDLTALQVKA